MASVSVAAAAAAMAALVAAAAALSADDEAERPAPLEEAAGRMTLPEGFAAALFAGEPEVLQPIGFAIDARGRLWVAECFSYPRWSAEEKDRIVILEDSDGDGRADRRKVFRDRIANLSGVEVGFGGVWACAIPYLLFIPDRDGDDVPDGEPEVVLDGWDPKAQHNVPNGLTWGPDGWLYGLNGILSNSRVGRPGTPDERRVPINCGVWRYHPLRQAFEAVAWGTTNPWGLDFDDRGEMFISNCVIPHIFHVVPGAHFQRMFGEDFNAHLYALMESCADHIHWAGGAWQDSRGGQGKHGEAGGGHAHAGAMVYLGDNWPERYRGGFFTANIHGNRINHDRLERSGSGYAARHEKDFLMANDAWFRGLELKTGPDGSVFITDWSDTGECHDTDAHGAHHDSGRIYKVTYGEVNHINTDLAALDSLELARRHRHPNDWHARTARRLLQERRARGEDLGAARAELQRQLEEEPEAPRKLRALWTLHAAGGLAPGSLIGLLAGDDESVRAWAARLLCEEGDPGAAARERFEAMARQDPSPRVRLHLASILQRLPLEGRWPIAAALAGRGEDADDASIPLMLWYAIEPLVPLDRGRALELAAGCRMPLVRRFIARRAAFDEESAGPAAIAGMLERAEDAALQLDLLAGVRDALRGRKGLAPPAGWAAARAKLARSPSAEVRSLAEAVALILGDPAAVDALEARLLDRAAPAAERRRALELLAERGIAGLAPKLRSLLDDPALRGPALRALAAYDDDGTPAAILERYAGFDAAARTDAVATLCARPAWARELLEAIEREAVPRRDLSAFAARQLLALGDPEIAARLERAWGSLRPTSREKKALIEKYKRMLAPEHLESADPRRGRAVYDRVCASCHRLFDSGGDVGPDITGSNRANLDYILENILDPSAAIGRDYKLVTVLTADRRLISGIIREQNERTLTIQTANDRIILDRKEVRRLAPSEVSMMPENILDPLTPDEVRALAAYLASPAQVPPAESAGGSAPSGSNGK